ncbi:MAG: molybdopterin-binding protein [Candidatus Humimicrobiaceae bacterium]
MGIISTGNEIIEIDKKLSPGKVRDSNSYSLASQVKEAGAKPVRYGIVPDHRDSLKKEHIRGIK